MLLRLEKNAGKHRQNAEKPVIYLSLKTDENQNKKQIKMHCCTWALCATAQKEKVYVLRLKLTHTALVNTYIWTICHFDCGNELERDWKLEETQKSENATAIFDRTGPTGQRRPPLEVDHFDRTNFHLVRTVPFPFGPKFPGNFGTGKHPRALQAVMSNKLSQRPEDQNKKATRCYLYFIDSAVWKLLKKPFLIDKQRESNHITS